MNEKIILEMVGQIEPQLFWLFLKFMGVGIVLLTVKGYMEGIAAYIQFRLDKRLNLEVKVRVRGIEGKIVAYNFSWIFVKHDNGMEIILIRRWRFEKWTIINGD
jgi:hypothetical protein